jgi:hypothetical protein
MKAADPAPRTQPYSNRPGELPLCDALLRASASANVVVGASIAACARLMMSSNEKPCAGTKAAARMAAPNVQNAKTFRSP